MHCGALFVLGCGGGWWDPRSPTPQVARRDGGIYSTDGCASQHVDGCESIYLS